MADETTLRLRIEGDTSAIIAALVKAGAELESFGKEADKAEKELKKTGDAAEETGDKLEKAAAKGHVNFKTLSGAFTYAQLKANALLEVIDKLGRAIVAPVTEILDAEQAAAMLSGTFGDLTTEMQAVQDLATQLGAQNAFFDDDALTQAGATLKLFGANSDAIKQLLPYVNNLAIAFGVDVNDASELVGQALMGNTRALGKMVPEVRGANSQLEVLAALQASSARNAKIAEERTAGLGGQFALFKRQIADIAQNFGNAMLPAMMAVMKFMNENLGPAIGRVMGAFAALGAYFRNLGKGYNFSDLMRIAGEAGLATEALYAAVKPTTTAPVVSVSAAAGGLSLKGSFGGGSTGAGGGAGASRHAAPVEPFSKRLETYTEDPGTKKAREDNERFIKAFDAEREQLRKARDEYAKVQQRAAEAELKFIEKIGDEADQVMSEIASKNLKDIQRMWDRMDDAVDNLTTGAISASSKFAAEILRGTEMSAADVTKGIIATAGSMAGDVASFIPGISDRAIKIVDKVSNALTDVLTALVDRISMNGEAAKKAKETWDKSLSELVASVEYNAGKAAAAFEDRMAPLRAVRAEEYSRLDKLIGPQAEAATRFAKLGGEKTRALIQAGGADESMFATYAALRDVFRFASGDTLSKVKDLLTPQIAEIAAGRQSSFMLTDAIKSLIPQLGLYDQGAVRDLLLSIAEFSIPGADAAGQAKPETINDGSSPDRPVYVFDVRPRDSFAFAPESFFFRNRGAGTSRGVSSGTPLGLPKAKAIRPGSLG